MILLLFLSCLHSPIQPVSYVQYYNVQLEALFQNVDDKKEYDQVNVQLDLRLSPKNRFKDDSVSFVLAISDGKATKNGEELPFTLTEKWVELRAFEFGELLSITHMEEWVDDNTYIDAFDVLWFVLFPNPPNIDEGETRNSLARYPLQYSEAQKSRAVLQNTWTITSLESDVQLSYEGDLDIRGQWERFRQSSKGKQEGFVVMEKTGGIPTSHSGTLKRTLCYTQATTLCQAQEFRYKMERRQ